MTQYVLQIIDDTHQLIKCYEVTPEDPPREYVPPGRTQAIITDTKIYKEAVADYEKHKLAAHYFWDGSNLTWKTP